MNSNCRSFQPTKLAVWGSILLMACTYSVSMAEVTEADMPETNFDQPAQPVYLETKDTPSLSRVRIIQLRQNLDQSLSLSLKHLKNLALTNN